jgi:hypothetical protein
MTTNGKAKMPQPGLDYDPALADNLEEVILMANEIGAQGIFVIRGAAEPSLTYKAAGPDGEPQNITMNLSDTGTLVVMRFPKDGGPEGVQNR